jgi:DNA-binding IclR family transcriptional regulator
MSEQPGDAIARRDEMLELLYWIEGEGFSGAASFEAITRFLAHPPETVHATLAELVAGGDVIHDAATAEYRLSPAGRREGARRFAEEFAPMLSQGHGECNDPNCDCHSSPGGAAECHGRRNQ